MPKGSREVSGRRRDEIIDACALLYQTMSFRDITIRDIGAQTSFTRTSIYNYFQTKEEIFLALLQREYEAWGQSLLKILQEKNPLTAAGFAERLADSLATRTCMLKLMSMNLYDMEGGSRLENLASFKTAYNGALQTLSACVNTFFPEKEPQEARQFVYSFFVFLFGLYPYTTATEKQQEAMRIAGVEAPGYSEKEWIVSFVVKML